MFWNRMGNWSNIGSGNGIASVKAAGDMSTLGCVTVR